MVEVILTVALLLPMMVLFGLTAGMGFLFYLMVVGITLLFPIIPGLLGTMIGTQIYHVLKSSSARTARIKATGAILILFAFMLFMFCKFPDIAAGNLGDSFSTSAFTISAGEYIQRLLYGDYLLIGIYFGTVSLVGGFLTYGLTKIYQSWYSNDTTQGSKYQTVDWGKQTAKQNNTLSALLARERIRYFSLPVYLTNTACGWLFAAVFVLLVVLIPDRINPYIYQLAEYFQVSPSDYDVLFIYAVSILTTISCTKLRYCKPVIYSSSCGLSGTYAIFRLQAIGSLSTEIPSKRISPSLMPIMPKQAFNVVVFPAPFFPMKPIMSPSSTTKLRLHTAFFVP